MGLGNSHQYAGYESKQYQLETYRLCVDILDIKNDPGFSLLEFGSGYGAFYSFLERAFGRGRFSYEGVDFNRSCADMSTISYGEFFLNTSFKEYKYRKDFSFGVCTGLLSGREEDFETIDLLLSKVTKSIAVQIFLNHPYLECETDELHLHRMKKYDVSTIRHMKNSIIWKIDKR